MSGGADSLALGHGVGRPTTDAVADTLDAVVPAVDHALGADSKRVVALLGVDRPELTASAAGLAAAAVTGSGSHDYLAIDAEAYDAASTQQRTVLLAHEVVHLRLQPTASPNTPLWLSEGMADVIGYQIAGLGPADVMSTDPMPAALPTAADLRGPDAQSAYLRAWATCDYLASRLGVPGLVALYDAVARSANPSTALESELAGLGLTTATLPPAVDGYLATILG